MISYETTGSALDAWDEGSRRRGYNVGSTERLVSTIVGGGLLLYGIKRGWRDGFLPALLGGALIYRGGAGRCAIYKMAGIDTSEKKPRPSVSVPHGEGIKVERSVIVNKTLEELYQFWRNPENLPRFMSHVASVQALDEKRSHWKLKSMGGTEFEWNAEIVNEKPNELIAWRTVGNADVDHAGSVHFEKLPADRGTKVRVVMEYRPPAGQLGAAVAKLFGEEPGQILETDLRRFKQLMETGFVASPETDAQSMPQH
jgi:uncharacterized membrane protein